MDPPVVWCWREISDSKTEAPRGVERLILVEAVMECAGDSSLSCRSSSVMEERVFQSGSDIIVDDVKLVIFAVVANHVMCLFLM